jgi:hypothetical protein
MQKLNQKLKQKLKVKFCCFFCKYALKNHILMTFRVFLQKEQHFFGLKVLV